MAVDEFAPMPPVADMVDAEDDEAAAERVIRPPTAVVILFDMEEASRFVVHVRNEAVAIVRWEGILNVILHDGSGPFALYVLVIHDHGARAEERADEIDGAVIPELPCALENHFAVRGRHRSGDDAFCLADFQKIRRVVLPIFIDDTVVDFLQIVVAGPCAFEPLVKFDEMPSVGGYR